MTRTLLRAGALAGVATLATVAAAPGYAATVSKASAAALTVEVAGEASQDSGRVTATNDGSGEDRSGTSNPPVSVLQGQDLLAVGTLAQDAEARVVNGQGRSAACAGIAGDGASLAEVGESYCLSDDGESVDLTLGNLGDVTDVQLADEASALAPLNQVGDALLGRDGAGEGSRQNGGQNGGQGEDPTPSLPTPGDEGTRPDGQSGDEGTQQGGQGGEQNSQDGGSEGQLEQQLPSQDAGGASATPASYHPGATSQRSASNPAPGVPEELRGPVKGAIEDALAQVDDEIGPIGITGSFGVLQSTCQAGPGLSGDANLADAGFYADVAGERVALLSLPVDPAPNTRVATDLSTVADLVIEAVQKNLNQELDALNEPIDQVQEQVVREVLSQVEAQLGPLEDNILEGTLNKQSRSGGAIDVTALDLQVLPAAQAELGAPLASLEVANVTCGGGEQAATAAGAAPQAPQAPQVPTVVTSGEQGSEGLPTGAVAGLLALLGAAGLVGYRRVLGR